MIRLQNIPPPVPGLPFLDLDQTKYSALYFAPVLNVSAASLIFLGMGSKYQNQSFLPLAAFPRNRIKSLQITHPHSPHILKTQNAKLGNESKSHLII